MDMALVHTKEYRMRTSPTYPGDQVRRRVWEFGGKRFEFTRIAWGDGSVTVRAYEGEACEPFREVTGCGGWQTDPVYLGECVPLPLDPEPVHTCGPGIQWGCDVPDCDGDNGD